MARVMFLTIQYIRFPYGTATRPVSFFFSGQLAIDSLGLVAKGFFSMYFQTKLQLWRLQEILQVLLC